MLIPAFAETRLGNGDLARCNCTTYKVKVSKATVKMTVKMKYFDGKCRLSETMLTKKDDNRKSSIFQ